jgi:hypothetical protein
MSCHLRHDQECETAGCGRPSRYGALCSPCFMAATPARRSVEICLPEDLSDWDIVAAAEACLGD